MVDKKLQEAHLALMRNPEPTEEEQSHAFRHAGGMNWEEEPILQVNEMGFPTSQVDAEAYAKDYAGYWRIHSNKAWLVAGFCLLYLSLKLFGA